MLISAGLNPVFARSKRYFGQSAPAARPTGELATINDPTRTAMKTTRRTVEGLRAVPLRACGALLPHSQNSRLADSYAITVAARRHRRDGDLDHHVMPPGVGPNHDRPTAPAPDIPGPVPAHRRHGDSRRALATVDQVDLHAGRPRVLQEAGVGHLGALAERIRAPVNAGDASRELGRQRATHRKRQRHGLTVSGSDPGNRARSPVQDL